MRLFWIAFIALNLVSVVCNSLAIWLNWTNLSEARRRRIEEIKNRLETETS